MDAQRRLLIAMHGMAHSGFVLDPGTIQTDRMEFVIRPFGPTMDVSIVHLRILSSAHCRVADTPRGTSNTCLLMPDGTATQDQRLSKAVLRLYSAAQKKMIALVKEFPQRVIAEAQTHTFSTDFGCKWYEVTITPEPHPWALIEHLALSDACELLMFMEHFNYRQAAIHVHRPLKAKHLVSGAKVSNVLLRSTDTMHPDMTCALKDAITQCTTQPLEVFHAPQL